MNYGIEPEWNQIVTDVGPSLYRYFSGTFSRSIAADLVQETLIRLVQKCRAGQFDSNKGDLKAFAYGIARFVRLETIKVQPPFDYVEDNSQLDVMDQSNTQRDDVAHLRWAINQLKPVEQEVILMMIDFDISLEEISQQLQMPLNTVKSHIHRAKEKLKEIMESKK